MSLIEELPVLFGIEKNGKTKTWRAQIWYNPPEAYSVIEYGQMDGKQQTARKDYRSGKNIGKKNETTALEQCTQETRKKWKDKQEKEGYGLTPTTTPHRHFPMLAQTYDGKKDVYPCFGQPKLDGLRCIVFLREHEIQFQSRRGVLFKPLRHIEDSLRPIFHKHPDTVLDGELYTDSLSFEQLTGLIRKTKTDAHPDDVQKIGYHVYDMICRDVPFRDRWKQLCLLLRRPSPHVQIVLTEEIGSHDQFREKFQCYVQQGFEGIILRHPEGVYECNYRSRSLLKYKEFQEQEFVIRDFTEGEGRERGSVIWVCETEAGKRFHVRPRGSLEQRRWLYEHGNQFLGRQLTVIFQEWGQDAPRFPVGKDVRGED